MSHLYLKHILLCCFFLFVGTKAFAYDALINGIYYDFSGTEATVTYRDYGLNSYSGDVVIPSSVTYSGKTYSVTSIGYNAFSECTNLTSVNIPNSVTFIGYWAFWNAGLTSIHIPSSVADLDWRGIGSGPGLSSITVDENNPYYCSPNNCNAIITKNGKTLVLGCKSTIIPENVSFISFYAFAGAGFTSITIPKNVSSIAEGAFSGCSDLSSITCLAENVPDSKVGDYYSAFTGLIQSEITLYVPASTLNAYKNAERWKDFGRILAIGDTSNSTSHEYVDLGLPSGTLWATCNVGANSPEEYGDYFAWGETQPKDNYGFFDHRYYDTYGMTDYCTNESDGKVDD